MPVETTLYTTLRGDDEPVEELPAEIIRYGYRLNRPGAIEFELSLDHETCRRDVIWPGVHEIVVERNRQVVWRGPVLTADEEDSEKRRIVSFGGEGLAWYLRKMHVTKSLQTANHPNPLSGATTISEDLAGIARALIGNADDQFGIDTTGPETSRNAQRTYPFWERKNVYNAILGLSNANIRDGIDFRIDPDTRRFIPSYPQQGARLPDLVWEDGIRTFGRTVDATEQASRILGIGEGEGEDMVLATAQDSGAAAEFGVTTERYVNKDVKEFVTLDDHTRRELALRKAPAQVVSVSVGTSTFDPFSVQVGVEGRLKYPSSYDLVSQIRRMVGFDIEWTAGDERAVLHLAPIF